MRPMLYAFLIFMPTLVQGSVPAPWPGRSLSDINTTRKQREAREADFGIPWERLEAGLVGGFVGGGVGLVVGVAADALSARNDGGGDALNGHSTNYAVAGVAVGAVLGGLGAFLFPGPGTPSLALHSEGGGAEDPVLVFDLCFVRARF